MKRVCPLCSNRESKRICKISNNAIICTLCCVELRCDDCIGCPHYENAQKFGSENKNHKRDQPKHFVKRIDDELDERINSILDLTEAGKFSEAEKHLLELLAVNNDYDFVHFALGTNYSLWKKFDKALMHFNKAIEIFPYHVESWFNKGVIHKDKFEIYEMIECFKNVVEWGDPNESFVYDALHILDGLSESVRESDGITLNEFQKGHRIFNEGVEYMEKEDWTKAIYKFEQTLNLMKRHTQSFGNLGICYAKIGEKKKALAALEKALSIDPGYEPAIINKRVIESLNEGERLNFPVKSEYYYKDKFLKDN